MSLQQIVERVSVRKRAAIAVSFVMLAGAVVAICRGPLVAAAADNSAARLAQAGRASAAPANPSPFTPEQKVAIEKIIKDYLISNPEVMMDIQTALESKMESIQAERLKLVLKENADQIFRRPEAPIAGNPNGDVTIVEFFDYNCPYCKKAFGDIANVLEKDPKVKVVFKELPILSKSSEEASKVALAARMQGKYWEMHRALLNQRGEVNEQSALKVAEKLGLDMAKLKKDMDAPEIKAEIETVRSLAQKMGIQGTPHFLVGDKAIPGAPQNLLETINGYIADIRKSGCSVC